jgi:transposase
MEQSTIEFEQLIERGCGIDVHKETAVATVGGKGIKVETKTYETFTSSLKEMKEWLMSIGITHIAMESTGVYWKPIFNILEDSFEIMLVNARHLKNVPGRKTDKADSRWICKLLLSGLLKGSFVPPENIRELRDLSRYKTKLTREVASEKNRIQRILEDANIKLSSVVSDTSGTVATKLIDGLISGRKDLEVLINECYHGKLSATKEELRQALTGRLTSHHVFMLKQMKAHIAYIESQILLIDTEMDNKLEGYNEELGLLQTIPGVAKEGAKRILSEIGANMDVFPDEHHLASWAGMCPGNNESAGKKKSSRTRHGNQYLKPLLVELAWGATRTKGTYFRAKYESMIGRRGKKRALLAIGHKILVASYHILKDKVPYQELGANYLLERKKKNKIDYLKRQLKELGYNIEKIEEAA